MFNQERKSLQFEWEHLGDIAWGRPTLGDRTSVLAYRLMQFTLRDAIIKHAGVEAANRIFFEAGEQAGRALYQHQLGVMENFEQFIEASGELLEDLKIGLLTLEKNDPVGHHFVLTIAEDLDCSGLPITNEMVCTFDEGVLAGLFAAHFKRKFLVRETDCWCTGDRVCRFEISPLTS